MNKNKDNLDHYRPFNLHRWSEEEKVEQSIDVLYERILEGPGNTRIRKKHLKVIVLDLYVNWLTDPELYTGYYRQVSHYKAKSRYNKLGISKLVIKVIDALVEHGYVDHKKGFYDYSSRTSRIRARKKLIELIQRHDVTSEMVERHPNTECIILRDINDDKKVEIEYEDTEETKSMRAVLVDYNNLLRKTHIDIPHVTEEGITTSKGYRVLLTEHEKFVRRIFNNGSFEEGGRFYGGWWQRLSKGWRSGIRLNRYPVVEHDYSGFHVRMLYAQEGLKLEGDAYDLSSEGVPTEDLRPFLKVMLLILLNARNEQQAIRAIRNEMHWNEQIIINLNLNDLIEAFTRRHRAIGKYFYSGYGIQLQRMDSSIAEHVIRYFTNKEVPILCVHDSFIAPTVHGEELTKEMINGYQGVLESKDVEISLSGVDPHRFRNDRDFIIDLMFINKDMEYERRLDEFLTRDIQPHYRVEE